MFFHPVRQIGNAAAVYAGWNDAQARDAPEALAAPRCVDERAPAAGFLMAPGPAAFNGRRPKKYRRYSP